MRYYTIQNNNVLTADNREALIRFYCDVKKLPEDYVEGKYIIVTKQEDYEVTDYDVETNKPIGTHTEFKVIQALELNPNYEVEEAKKEAERVSKLTCTKRVFALMLQELGITYTQIKALIATNEQAQLEWDLCIELERKNPLLDVTAMQLGITSAQLDALFKCANGEITIDEFRDLKPQEVENG